MTCALDVGDLPASHPGRFTPGERATIKHELVGWVDLRACLDPSIVLTSEIEMHFVGHPNGSLATALSGLSRIRRLVLSEEMNRVKNVDKFL